jgi:predicted RNase H-like nuclease (RuvC/YqgF family)
MSKCFRCEKRRSQPLHYLCKQCYNDDDGEPKSAGEEIIRLKRELAEAREQRDRLAEALDKIRRWGCTDGHCSHIAGSALATVKGVKGGNDE